LTLYIKIIRSIHIYIMGWKTKEQQKAYNQKYYQKTRLKQLEDKKEYAQLNKEIISQKNKKYREKNKDKLNEYHREWYNKNKDTKVKDYNNSEKGIKANTKSEWKRHGINIDYFHEVYDRHINIINCEVCNCILTKDKYLKPTTKCIDHNHITGYYRHTICNSCNLKRGFIDSNYLQVIKELKNILS